MNTLKDFVNWKLTHSDKVAEVEGYPLIMENCKKNKKMKQLKIYGNSVQVGTPAPENPIEVQGVGDLVTDETDVNYGKYKISVKTRGVNLFNKDKLSLLSSKWNIKSVDVTETGVLITPNIIGNDNSTTIGYCYVKIGLASDYAGKTITLTSPVSYSNATKPQIFDASGKTMIKQGNNFTLRNGLYYSSISIDEDTYTDEILVVRLYFNTKDLTVSDFEYAEFMLAESDNALPYEPYIEPVTTNIFFDKPLGIEDYIDYKNKKVVRGYSEEIIQCHLPTLISKTSIIDIETGILPSLIYGKYIKK